MPENPVRPSFRDIYRQQYQRETEKERSYLPLRIARLLPPAAIAAGAISGEEHWVPLGVSLIILAVSVTGVAGLIIWDRRRRRGGTAAR